MTLHVRNAGDWAALSREGLDVVVDPMVVRSGEVFLNGSARAKDAAQSWSFLDRNVHALAMFFDTLVLEDRIPVFNYGETFDSGLDFDRRVFGVINGVEPVLEEVSVEYAAYMEVKAAALAELRKLYSGPKRIERPLAEEILSETAEADYQWTPHLGELEGELSTDLEKNLARFFLGGLIFGAYAQILGGEHVIQPKRSRLFLAASMNKRAANRFEEELFGELKRRARSSVTEWPWRPTLFPYLLSVADTPEALLTHAMRLRRSGEVRDYRAWVAAAKSNWERDGQLGPVTKDVKKIAAAIDRRTSGAAPLPKVEVKVDVVDVAAMASGVPKLPGKVDFTPTLAALWGWSIASLPGRRHRKLLTRAIASDQAYVQIENRIKSVWSASG